MGTNAASSAAAAGCMISWVTRWSRIEATPTCARQGLAELQTDTGVLQGNVVRLLLLCPCDLLPFVKPIGHDQATALAKRTTKCGLGGCRLGAGIDQAVADFRIVSPAWNEPTAQLDKLGPRGLAGIYPEPPPPADAL